jgi:hypothetical protein
MGRLRDAEAPRVPRRGEEAVVARAGAVEEAAQQGVLRVGARVGEEEPDAQAAPELGNLLRLRAR